MKKILIGIILGLSSIISQASPTDCRQLAEDGEVDCIKREIIHKNTYISFI